MPVRRRMVAGYLAACAMAITTTSILTVIVIVDMESGSKLLDSIKAFLLGVPVGFAFLLIAALPVAVAIVAIARFGEFNRWAYYTAGGASSTVLAAIGIAMHNGAGDLTVTNMSTYISLFPAALTGSVAGLTYWCVAVRERKAERESPPEPKGWGT